MHALNLEEILPRRRPTVGGLSIDPDFHRFVEDELLPAAGVPSAEFWPGVEAIITELTPLNRHLIAIRKELQESIDAWHKEHQGESWSQDEYVGFLRKIGYLKPPGKPFKITTRNVDPEIASTSGPQLVVPLSNARFAINAANARWGSLFDALYGSDVIPADEGRSASDAGYNPARGASVIDYATGFLDRVIPLKNASHADVVSYSVVIPMRYAECLAELADGRKVGLADRRRFVGWTGYGPQQSLLFKNNDLHFEICTDPEHPVGRDAPGNICDVIVESAITTIQDCEDSVAAVDAEDKTQVYRNWLGLMQGTLEATFDKGDNVQTRRLNRERKYIGIDGSRVILPGTSLMLVRNVGHLMTSDAIIDSHGDEVFEGILDAIVTTAAAISNVRQKRQLLNSQTGSIYIVKPKMHGPGEVAFANTLFGRVEQLFGLPRNAIKIGIMDEERRTSVNLQECIRAVRERLVFINTGFLDRTGDEIHTSMHAGPMLPKERMKQAVWMKAYEDRNVALGIRCGLPGKAQIGKGMWPMPDEMKRMMDIKQAHPDAGANCAWVPSPTAATLHALHYHAVNVTERQRKLASGSVANVDDLLLLPVADANGFDERVIQEELDNNVQSILGYVVRWIDQGIGCSKVPDNSETGLMEDRATLRISSQHIANWLLHGVCTEAQVRDTLQRMAQKVDAQNAGEPGYVPMSNDLDKSIAFQAASELVFKGGVQPNGYTDPLLHQHRKQKKRRT
jgi:malate synthase